MIANFEGRAAGHYPVLGGTWICTVPLGLSIGFFFWGMGKHRKGRALSPSFAVTREGHYGSMESLSLPE